MSMNILGGINVCQALADAGWLHDLKTIKRVIIELRADQPIMIHVERFGGTSLAELLPDLLIREDAQIIDPDHESATKVG